MEKYRHLLVIGGVIVLVVLSLIVNLVTASDEGESIEFRQVVPEHETRLDYIYVDVRGAVYKPGVYKIAPSWRVFQVVELAGGLRYDADFERLNLSQKVVDQALIIIPYKDGDGDENQEEALISLSHATKEELITLPNIGPSTADNIIAYRQENGPFLTIEEIVNVSGIGQATLDAIRDYVRP